jgi:general nucleoside transport system permease protein
MILDMIVELLFSTLNILPIFLIAALGGYLSQRVGVYDVSMEGNMTLGCSLGMIGFFLTNSPWFGMLFGFLGGAVFGAILSTFAVRFNLDQIVVGFGLWFVGQGLASFLYKVCIPFDQSTVGFDSIAAKLGLMGRGGILAEILNLDVIFFLSIALLIAIVLLVNRTRLGLFMRAAGENPVVVDAAGADLYAIRQVSVTLGAALVGSAGAYLAVDFLQGFSQGMVAGRGWIAFVIIIFARWKPVNIFWGCLLFAGINGLQVRLQVLGVQIPSDLLTALPYVVTLVVLVFIMARTGKSRIPSSLGVPYYRE